MGDVSPLRIAATSLLIALTALVLLTVLDTTAIAVSRWRESRIREGRVIIMTSEAGAEMTLHETNCQLSPTSGSVVCHLFVATPREGE